MGGGIVHHMQFGGLLVTSNNRVMWEVVDLTEIVLQWFHRFHYILLYLTLDSGIIFAEGLASVASPNREVASKRDDSCLVTSDDSSSKEGALRISHQQGGCW